MRRIKRFGARRRSDGWIGVLLVGLIAAVSAPVLLATAATTLAMFARSAGGPEVARADSRCNYRVYAPVNNYSLTTHSSSIVARARFSCTTSHRNSTATVVMERFSNGKWNEVASRARWLDVRAGVKYVVQAKWRPPVNCRRARIATLKLRTHFALKLNRTLTIVYTTPGENDAFPCA
jgi:hypothetical protein